MDTGIILFISLIALHSVASTSRTNGQRVAEPRQPSRSFRFVSEEVASRKDGNDATFDISLTLQRAGIRSGSSRKKCPSNVASPTDTDRRLSSLQIS